MLLAAALLFLAPQQPLASYVDRNRVLILFAPTPQDPRFQQQLKLLTHHTHELKERDLILIPAIPAAAPSDELRTLESPYPTTAQQLEMRSRFHIQPSEFTVLLLGKDGGEKLRQHAPITIEKLSATIDAMPMRQDEMRRQK